MPEGTKIAERKRDCVRAKRGGEGEKKGGGGGGGGGNRGSLGEAWMSVCCCLESFRPVNDTMGKILLIGTRG